MKKEDIIKLAEKASLYLQDNEIEEFAKDLEKMIDFTKQLDTLDTDGVDLSKQESAVYNVFRKDEIKPSMDKEALLANAPQVKDGYFFVPQVVE